MKVTRWSDVIGNTDTVSILLDRLKDIDTFPKFIILEGEEGLGKSSIARLIAMSLQCENRKEGLPCYACENCKSITSEVILNNNSIEGVQVYKLANRGGKDTVNELVSTINTQNITTMSKRVFIGEEAHRLSEPGQDALLCDAEHLPDDVYLIFCSTDIQTLNKSLVSRAVKYKLQRLSTKAMERFINNTMEELGLSFDYPQLCIPIIAAASERKPREACSIIQSLSRSTKQIKLQDLNSFVGLDVMPTFSKLIKTFETGLHYGLDIIANLDILPTTQKSLSQFLADILKARNGMSVYTLDIRDLAEFPDNNVILNFLNEITMIPSKNFTREYLLGAYCRSHKSFNRIMHSSSNAEYIENQVLSNIVIEEESIGISSAAQIPTLDDLLNGADLVKE